MDSDWTQGNRALTSRLRSCASRKSQSVSADGNCTFYPISPPMLIFLPTLLSTLSSMLHSRVALEPENLALRHPVAVPQRSARKRPKLTPADRLYGAAVPPLERLAFGPGHRQARNGRGLASCRPSPVLDLRI